MKLSAPLEFANVVLTTDDAVIASTPKDIVWTHRQVTLYRYRSDQRTHRTPILLVFALINTPQIFDLRSGSSLVEYLLGEGFDVFLLDWGEPDEEDAEMGFEEYVCDELHWGIRETLRASGAEQLTLAGWCMGATMCAMYCGLPRAGDSPVRNLVLLTMPIDGRDTVYARWTKSSMLDSERVAEAWGSIPGWAIDFANKLVKPVTNFWTTYRMLAADVANGTVRRDAYQAMAKWIAENPAFPGKAWVQWLQWIYRDGTLVKGELRLRGQRVELSRIDQPMLVITADRDHIAPPPGTMPIFGLVSSEDVTHLDRPGGHIGLVAGSSAKKELWPELAEWLAVRSADTARRRSSSRSRGAARSASTARTRNSRRSANSGRSAKPEGGTQR